jgi:TM2 domain-containing membrane protein YozV
VAYALAIFFGIVGVHRLYLNKWKTALGFMGLAVLGIAFLIPEYFRLSWIIGAVLLGIVAIAWVYDLFTLPRQVREANAAVAEGGATE